MTAHKITVYESRHGSYRWLCSCGDKGKRTYGYPGYAQRYGADHVKAKGGAK